MPAMVTHYLFALRVFSKLKKVGVTVADTDTAMIGAQGPDIFFFHRVLPWQPGVSYTHEGSMLHKISPAKLFEGFRSVLNQETAQRDAMLGYIEGMFCHYALDRAAHPFVYYWQEQLRKEQPRYGKNDNQYHFRIESALDTLLLRRETGRLMRDFKLVSLLPPERDDNYAVVGRLYQPLFGRLLGTPYSEAEHIAKAVGDMRQALWLMTDRTQMRQRVLHPLEKIAGQGHALTSLLRPAQVGDWDYANEKHALWTNPFDEQYTSSDSFYDLYEWAACEAADMIVEFLDALPDGKSMQEITQDRGFSSDLPGVYEIK